ncbi:alpha/beta fold hydrolase [Streptomyces xanthophaeus]|uniref:alpha/beta fold hydrolase n=1 Tax=Streptomyces xanthophaeus TaxID=67385 RepID=UPI003864C496|nr:alpha/beta fold hydrolase [Streptomyces xanthophaeus]WST64467.1 alpha/beta fold hydrolase [Streptomyces xanthophaeus]
MGDGDRLGVVFVHGFNSGPKVWDRFLSLIEEDADLDFVDTRTLRYATGFTRLRPDRALPSLSTVADHLKTLLETERAPRPLVLVGHSMGGLVIQRWLVRMLAEGRGRELARIRRVVLLACPNAGSDLARGARRQLLGGNPQERQLRTLDEDVRDTHTAVLRDIVGADAVSERTCPIPFSVYAAESDAVVPRASAQGAFPRSGVLPGDHFSVVQPRSRDHASYSTLRHLLREEASGSDPPAVRTVSEFTPKALEVHGAPPPGGRPEEAADGPLTPYLPRPHDMRLRAALDTALRGGTPRLLVLTGESATGKTRALYEALLEQAPDRPLLTPSTAADLLSLLRAGRLPRGSVLWLNEAQRFFYGAEGEAVAQALHERLARDAPLAALATLWTRPYWAQITASDRTAHVQARALLTHPALALRLTVPPYLDGDDLSAWEHLEELAGDLRLGLALEAGRGDGRVIQQLTGGPQLLEAFLAGPGVFFTPPEHALIGAALDARRLGHHAPMAPGLLARAADGALTPRQRSGVPGRELRDLTALSEGTREDGTPTDVRTLTALCALRPRSGAPAVFEPADYLDQHMRGHRAELRPDPALWDALLEHADDPGDLVRLGRSAWDRGLRRHAALLWRRAVLAGDASAPALLVSRLRGPLDPAGGAVRWAAVHCTLENPFASFDLMRSLADADAEVEVAEAELRARGLMDRLEEFSTIPLTLYATLTRLWDAGARSLAQELLDRGAVTRMELTRRPGWTGLPGILSFLNDAGAHEARAAFLARGPVAHLDPDDLAENIWMLKGLLAAGAREAAEELVEHCELAARTDVRDARTVADLLFLLDVMRSPAKEAVLARDPAGRGDLAHAESVAWLLRTLDGIGADDAVAQLLARDPAAHVGLGNETLEGVTFLLETLDGLGAERGAATLRARMAAELNPLDPDVLRVLRAQAPALAREALVTQYPVDDQDPDFTDIIGMLLSAWAVVGDEAAAHELLALDPVAHADLKDSLALALLVRGLTDSGAGRALRALLDRNPAAHADTGEGAGAEELLSALRDAGAEARAEAEALAERSRDAGTAVPARLLPYGCDPDGRATPPWTWADLPPLP